MTKTVADLLQIARGALADIARNTDMTKDQLQAKANRIYWETEPSDEPTCLQWKEAPEYGLGVYRITHPATCAMLNASGAACDCGANYRSTEKSGEGYQIQCECGWIGKTSELVTIKFSQGKNCPKCKASFKTVGLPDIEPK